MHAVLFFEGELAMTFDLLLMQESAESAIYRATVSLFHEHIEKCLSHSLRVGISAATMALPELAIMDAIRMAMPLTNYPVYLINQRRR
jgi:hypothetical protein